MSRRARKGTRLGSLPRWLRDDRVGLGIAVLVTLAVLLGGASQRHALRLAVVELASLPLLGLTILRLWDEGRWRAHRLALAIAGAVVAVPLLQLVPLPPAIWTALPGREQAALALEVAGLSPGWSPFSLTPDLTHRSLLALLPPLTIFLAVLGASGESVRRLPRLVLGLTVASLALAFLQLATGGDAFYPWRWTDRGDVVGFFANRNHLATMCLMALPFCAERMGRALRRGAEGRGALSLWSLTAGGLVVALVLIQSRMGVILTLPMLAAGVLTARMAAGRRAGDPRILAALAAGLVAVSAVAWLTSGSLMDRFYADEADMRAEGWPVAFEAAQAQLPGGAGMGSFDRIYRSVEPLEQVDPTYFNRAHNDYLETWLEAGWAAAGILIAFLIWYGRRLATIWRRPETVEAAAPAAAAAVLAVLAHSVADYPLRTVTITVLFALCCALMERRGGTRRRSAGLASSGADA